MSWAGVAALATLLSAVAAMTTAVTGVWRPPVPVPIPRISVTWVPPNATAAPAASPTTSAAAGTTSATAPPTPAPVPVNGSYRSDWTAGMNGWVGATEWKTVPGLLVSDGSAGFDPGWASQGVGSVRAPFRPGTGDYAVEARIQIVDPQPSGCYVDLQLRGAAADQSTGTNGYVLGFVQGSGAVVGSYRPGAGLTTIDHATFSPGTEWHVYHAEVRANRLTLQIDGSTVLQTTDNSYLDPGQVGLGNGHCQVQVSSFTVGPL